MSTLEELTIDQLREIALKAREMEPSYTLVQNLSKDPEARTMLQRYLKKKNPNLSIPEVDTEDRMMRALAEEKAAREKLEAKLTEDEARRSIEAQKRAVMEKFELSDEDMQAIEKRMLKSDDNPDPLPPRYDWAAQLYVNSRTPSTPTPSSYFPPTYQMPDSKVWGKGIGNQAELNRIAMDQARIAWEEVHSGKKVQ